MTTHDDPRPPAAPPVIQTAWRQPRAAFAGIVTQIVGYRETGGGRLRQVEAASLDIPLVISFGDPFAIGLGRDPSDNERYGSFTSGLFAGPVTIDSFGASHCLQINFTPLGARQFFAMPMTELSERMVALDDVLGAAGGSLREQLGATADWESRFDLAEAFVADRLAKAHAPAADVAWAFDAIAATGGARRIASIAREIGLSRKHLVDRFRREVGLGPKSVSRIVRMRRALSAAGSGDGWADIAADCGYADQAHMVREFRDLAGRTPSTLAIG
ncbi:AraC family transcriptional regulator [Mesorhizobium sp. VNQ89]|uniref:helix-turn-helix domain-containing protein n=1 Tax=Mesorhizobium quangtriensis TaxID=3157709 RepID=UPI0032B737F5